MYFLGYDIGSSSFKDAIINGDSGEVVDVVTSIKLNNIDT